MVDANGGCRALLRVYHIPAQRCLILSQTAPLGMGQSVVDGQRLERCLLHVVVSQPTDHFHCDSLCHVKEACASKMVVFSSVVLWVRSRALEYGCCFFIAGRILSGICASSQFQVPCCSALSDVGQRGSIQRFPS